LENEVADIKYVLVVNILWMKLYWDVIFCSLSSGENCVVKRT